MYIYKELANGKTKLVGVRCSVCKKHFSVKKDLNKILNFYNVRLSCSKESLFGAGELDCDICEQCLYNLIGEYVERGGDERISAKQLNLLYWADRCKK